MNKNNISKHFQHQLKKSFRESTFKKNLLIKDVFDSDKFLSKCSEEMIVFVFGKKEDFTSIFDFYATYLQDEYPVLNIQEKIISELSIKEVSSSVCEYAIREKLLLLQIPYEYPLLKYSFQHAFQLSDAWNELEFLAEVDTTYVFFTWFTSA